MTNPEINRPSFFCVGAAKSGTSALQAFLRQHHQIFMPRMKEIHHFAPDLLGADDPWLNKSKYAALFQKAQSHQIIGETSVFYLLSELAAQKIQTFNPKIRCIMGDWCESASHRSSL